MGEWTPTFPRRTPGEASAGRKVGEETLELVSRKRSDRRREAAPGARRPATGADPSRRVANGDRSGALSLPPFLSPAIDFSSQDLLRHISPSPSGDEDSQRKRQFFSSDDEAMAKETSRASWGHTYERDLVDILVGHNVPIYRGQNGWLAQGWRSITTKFNQKFPCAQYTKQQLQEKEKDMKANYRAIQQARKLSGTGWDDSLSMIIAEPEIWQKIKKDYPRVSKYEAKPFMLFPKLALLYEGSIATVDLNFVSIPQVDLTSGALSPTDSSTDGGHSSSNLHSQGQGHQNVEPTTSASSEQKVEEPVIKRKQSQIAVVLEDYVDFRKKQTQQFVKEMEEPKQVDQFSIAHCVAALEPMADLTIAEKSKALRLFKCQLNREIFLNTKDPGLRVFWLKEEIASIERT